MKPHALVAMPFGTKPHRDGMPIDFDRVYAELIKPAQEYAGCKVFRANEEQRTDRNRCDVLRKLPARAAAAR